MQSRCRFVALALTWAALSAVPGPRAQTGPPVSTALVDVVALDAAGKPVLDLAPGEFQVEIGGQPRAVRGLRYVFRGAGAEEAARGALATVPAAAIPGRHVLVAVDENTVRRGAEKAVTAGVWRVVEGLTPADLVGVVLLPRPRGNTQLSVDHEPVRAALRGLAGRVEATLAAGLADAFPGGLRPRTEDTGSAAPQPSPESTEAGQPREAPQARRDEAREGEEAAEDDSLEVLTRVIDGWRGTGDARIVVYVSGGSERRAPGVQPSDRLPELVDAAARARARIHVVHVAAGDASRPAEPLVRLAASTGATTSVVTAKRADTAALAAALAGGYVLDVERHAGDRPDRPAELRVKATRKGVRLVAPSRWVPRDDLLPEPVAAPAAEPAPASPAPARATSRRDRERQPDPELDAVLARVGQYVATYLREFGNVIAEEHYMQTLTRFSARTSRRTRADLLLLKGDEGWVPFRDVFEVDGRPLRDRDERLKALFLEDPGNAMAQGKLISDESARFNLGAVYRTINTPLVTLSFFHTANLPSFEFERRGTPSIDGTRVWRIGYREVGSPTQIAQGSTGADLPSKGALWVDPASGRVLRTDLETGDAGVHVQVTVEFAPDDALGMWVPERMEERYWQPARNHTIAATARYSRFRRFAVSTDEMLGPPR